MVTGIWDGGERWGRFVTLGGSFYGYDSARGVTNTKPAIDCSPSDTSKRGFILTVERWTEERKAGHIVPAE